MSAEECFDCMTLGDVADDLPRLPVGLLWRLIFRIEANIFFRSLSQVGFPPAFSQIFAPVQQHRDILSVHSMLYVWDNSFAISRFLWLDPCVFRVLSWNVVGSWLSPNRDELVTLFFEEPFMQAIQTNCPWLLRYLVTAIILTKVR